MTIYCGAGGGGLTGTQGMCSEGVGRERLYVANLYGVYSRITRIQREGKVRIPKSGGQQAVHVQKLFAWYVRNGQRPV